MTFLRISEMALSFISSYGNPSAAMITRQERIKQTSKPCTACRLINKLQSKIQKQGSEKPSLFLIIKQDHNLFYKDPVVVQSSILADREMIHACIQHIAKLELHAGLSFSNRNLLAPYQLSE